MESLGNKPPDSHKNTTFSLLFRINSVNYKLLTGVAVLPKLPESIPLKPDPDNTGGGRQNESQNTFNSYNAFCISIGL